MEEKQEKKKNIDVDKVKSVLNKLNAWMLYPERRMSDRTEILSLMQEGKLTDEERYIISSALKEMNIKGTLEKLENLSPEQVDKFEKQTYLYCRGRGSGRRRTAGTYIVRRGGQHRAHKRSDAFGVLRPAVPGRKAGLF